MDSRKEFGTLSADQLLAVLGWLPILESVRDQLTEAFTGSPERLAALAPNGLRWSGAYELSVVEHTARLTVVMGLADFVRGVAMAPDPTQAVLDSIHLDDAEPDLAILGERNTFPYMAGLIWGLLLSFECLVVYGRYIHELIAEVRNEGKGADEALLRAIRVDPTVTSCPTAARRISGAVVSNDQVFLAKLRLAMEGKTGDQVAYLRRFRAAVKLLMESGGLGDSPTALARRLVDLGIYSDGPTAVKNAAELIRKAKKTNAI